METLEQCIERLTKENISLVPYDSAWPKWFQDECEHLRAILPRNLVGRIEHFGSTAVPGLAAKPIIDMLIEVTDLEATKLQIAPLLQAQGYEYLWRPTHGDDGPPWYAWFIKRDPGAGVRTHHLHMVEADFDEHWNRLLFRDFLIDHRQIAKEYETLKYRLAAEFPLDRAAYTRGKTAFVRAVTDEAQRYYKNIRDVSPAQ